MESKPTNPEIDQDRVHDLFEMFEKTKKVMFHQQLEIYKQLAQYTANKFILEAGCGVGVGTAILARSTTRIVGTDKLQRNIDFAKCMYPWIDFRIWDIHHYWHTKAEVVVCVDAFEHVANPQVAMGNLIQAATQEVWISTPNGDVKNEHPPSNQFHVAEYTCKQMLEMIFKCKQVSYVSIWEWDNMMNQPNIIQRDTDEYIISEKTPLVYRATLDTPYRWSK